MIQVKLPDRTIAVVFSHPKIVMKPRDDGRWEVSNAIRGGVETRETLCEIFEVDEGGKMIPPRVAWGVAHCIPIDPFVKATGRKIALTRALGDTTAFTKFMRTAIWAAYLNRK